jgi:hypothetical protein
VVRQIGICFCTFSFKANEIQRAFRGLLGRNIVRAKLRERGEDRQLSLFNYLCTQLQKCFRGYYSRKYKHDQARRKEYCRMLVEQGEMVRKGLQQYAEELAEVRLFQFKPFIITITIFLTFFIF